MAFSIYDYKGVIPAMMTPFKADNTFDKAAAREMVDWMIAQGSTGFYLTGSNGSGPYMESKERNEVVETMMEAINGRVPAVAHIAFVSPTVSAQMAKHAASVGCTGISGVPGYYFHLSPDEMYRYYSEIAEATDLPLLVYAMTHLYTPSVEMFQKLSKIPNVKGVKYTGPDHYMMGRIKEHLGKDFLVYSGRDEQFLSGVLCGVDGIIGGSYNLLPDLYIRAVDELWAGKVKEAQKDMLAANAILEALFPYDFNAAMRACLGFIGVNAGLNPTPMRRLDADEKAHLKKDLQELKAKLDIAPIALFDAI